MTGGKCTGLCATFSCHSSTKLYGVRRNGKKQLPIKRVNRTKMKLSKNLPALIVLAAGVIGLASASAMCTATANAPALDPVRYTEARATETAIAPAVHPTEQYNEIVLPTQQAVEAQEIVEMTRNRYEQIRKFDKAKGAARVVVTWSVAFAIVVSTLGVGVGVGGFAGARGVREIRQAALPMTRQLVEGPHITEHGTITHTATGATWQIDAPGDAQPEHARLVSATYQAMPQNVLVELLQRQRGKWQDVRLLER